VAALSRALVLLLLATGCASLLRPDSARTAPPGTNQLLVAPSIYLGSREDANIANVDVMARRGVGSRVDLGLRGSIFFVGLDAKVQLWRASDPGRGVDVALSPSLGYGEDITWSTLGREPTWAFQPGLALLVDVNLGGWQLLISPTVLYEHVSILPAGVLNVGGTIAFGRPDGPGLHFRPALAMWKAVDPRNAAGDFVGPGAVVFQPSLVLHWN
jgi:hypothetical protein